MRIPSGVTDQYLYFVAVDSTDFTTRETGLTAFTVYRSRNNGAATVMTTPAVAELSAANMPGVYSLLLDEDMSIDSGDDTEEMAFHITQASMAPVTRTIELYRPKITVGNTLGVAADGDVSGNVDGSVASVLAAIVLPTIPTDWIAAAGIAANALDGKGNWNQGKTGYALTVADWNVGKTGYDLTVAPLTAAQTEAECNDALVAFDTATAADITALENISAGDVNAQVVDVLKTDTIAERTSGAPPVAPTFEQAIMYLYMMLTKEIDVDSGFKEFSNDAGVVIWKKALTDDASNYVEAKGVTGP